MKKQRPSNSGKRNGGSGRSNRPGSTRRNNNSEGGGYRDDKPQSGRDGADRPSSGRREGRPSGPDRRSGSSRSEQGGDRRSSGSRGRSASNDQGRGGREGGRDSGRYPSRDGDNRRSYSRDGASDRPSRSDGPARSGGSDRNDNRRSYSRNEGDSERSPRRRSGESGGDNNSRGRSSYNREEGGRGRTSRDESSGRSSRSDGPARSGGSDRSDNRRSYSRNDGDSERSPGRRTDSSGDDNNRGRSSYNREEGGRGRTSRPDSDRDNRSSERSTERRSGYNREEGNERRSARPEGGREERSYNRGEDRRSSTGRNYDRRSAERPERSSDRRGPDRERDSNDRPGRPAGRDSKWSDSGDRKKPAFKRGDRSSGFERKRPSAGRPYSTKKHTEKVDDGSMRLNRYIAHAGICSRREADELIGAGAVAVNGKIITELGFIVQPGDKVQYGGQTLSREKTVYILLNKPKDYITTTDDPQKRKTVLELLQDAGRERVYPVGRLDRNTTGVLLLTNDGDLSKKLLHPRYGVKKIYHVTADKNVKKDDLAKMIKGIELEDGIIKADHAEYVGDGKDKKEIGLELHSGKNRVVRRMMEALGYDVIKLDRVVFAGLTKKDLPRGKWRYLQPKEVSHLKMQAGNKE